MPKIKAKMLGSKQDGSKLLGTLQFDGKVPPRDAIVSVKWGSSRSNPQNSLYWAFLNWCIKEGGLKRDHGYYSVDGLHENLKAHFLAEKTFTKGQFKAIEDATTTDLTKSEFSEYFEAVEHFMRDFFGIDTAEFWNDERTESKEEIF